MGRLTTLALVVAVAGCATAPPTAPGAATPEVTYPALTLYVHPATRVEIPAVVWPERPDVERRIREALAEVAGELTCAPGTPATETHDLGTRVDHLADEVFSVSIVGVADCGGEHPLWLRRSLTFDLRTGRAIDFDDLFDDYDDIRPIVAAAVYGGRPSTLPPDQCLEPPDLYDAERLAEGDFDYTLAPDGMRVAPLDFPHPAEGCAIEVVVPYARLAPLAAPDGVLARMAARYAPASAP